MNPSHRTSPENAAADIERAAALMQPLTELVVRAGAAILDIRHGPLAVEAKNDGSPVTQADLAADAIIAEGLARLLPGIPAISEERTGAAATPLRGGFFLIDPLDGTKEFIAGRDEFTVNLALVAGGVPALGIVGVPAMGMIWRGLLGRGAERIRLNADGTSGEAGPVHTRALPRPGAPWSAAVSRSHGDPRTDAFIAGRPGGVRKPLGSAVKFCAVAEGAIDIYPRLAPTHEWDVAAGHALVAAAGGKVTDSRGDPLRFGGGEVDFIIPEFIAWGDAAAAPRPPGR